MTAGATGAFNAGGGFPLPARWALVAGGDGIWLSSTASDPAQPHPYVALGLGVTFFLWCGGGRCAPPSWKEEGGENWGDVPITLQKVEGMG